MVYQPDVHHRRSIRLSTHDYASAGAYFITICTHRRKHLYGDVVDGVVQLNDQGRIVNQVWRDLPVRYPHVAIDAFVVMPDHVHGILVLTGNDETGGGPVGAGSPRPLTTVGDRTGAGSPRPYGPTLGRVIAYWKYQSTKLINEIRGTPGQPVWQRNYFERIIRDDIEWDRTRWYIDQNPANWHRYPNVSDI